MIKENIFIAYRGAILQQKAVGCPLHPSRKAIVIASSLGPMTSSAAGFRPGFQYQTWTLFCGVGLKSDWEADGLLHGNRASIAQSDTPCWKAGISTSRSVGDRSPLAAFMAPSGIVKTSQPGGSFQFGHSLISHVLLWKYAHVVSSTTGAYRLVLVYSQQQYQ